MRWLVLMLFLLVATVAHADVAPDPIAAGGDLQLMKEASVRMKREHVTIRLYPIAEVVEASFVLVNDGATKSLQIGFPGEGVRTKSYEAHLPLHNFSATVDGTAVTTTPTTVHHRFKTPQGERGYDETWHTFDANLPKGKDVNVVVRYGVQAVADWNDETKSRAAYILETGKPWKGGIDQAVIDIVAMTGVDGAAVDIKPRMPKQAERTKDGLKLTYVKLEPTQEDNLHILYRVDPTAKPARDANASPYDYRAQPQPDWNKLVPNL
jgi:hypothetical protein